MGPISIIAEHRPLYDDDNSGDQDNMKWTGDKNTEKSIMRGMAALSKKNRSD